MLRLLLICALALGAVAPVESVAKGAGKRHPRPHPTQLIWRDLANHAWSPNHPSIQVINRSDYSQDEIANALAVWALPGVPMTVLTQDTPIFCNRVRPIKGAVVICNAPDDEGGAGWVRRYTRWKKNARGNHKRMQDIHAGVIWLYDRPNQPTWALRVIVAHEFGHALGLPHLPCDKCLMNASPWGDAFTDELGMEDLAALRQLYP